MRRKGFKGKITRILRGKKRRGKTTFIEEKINVGLESKTQIFATKDDIATVNFKMEQFNTRLEQTKSELIKWMFIFWVGQVVATFGFILLFLKSK